VAIDADTETVLHHHQQLAGCLTGANQNDRTPKESIVLLVPKRNIETWILCLSGKIVDGSIVDETTDYKKASEIERQLRPAAVTLAEWSRPSARIPEYCVPSLRNGLTELKRIT